METCPACNQPLPAEIQGKKFCPLCAAPLPPPRPPTDRWLGKVLADRFLIEELLGEGGYARVYRARHCTFAGRVAVKILLPILPTGDKEPVARLYREAIIAGALNHPNLVRVHDCGTTPPPEEVPYLVMDYLEGVTLHQAIQDAPDRCLGVVRTLSAGIQVARVLRHLHQRKVIHRDIKPNNIMLTARDGEPEWATVLDLGIAKAPDQSPLTRGIVGTAGYLPPETILGDRAQVAGDIYALGSTLFEALTGSYAFDGPTAEAVMMQQISAKVPPSARERRPDAAVPEALDLLIGRMLAVDPAARPTAEGVVAELEARTAALPRMSPRKALMTRHFEQYAAPGTPAGAETVLSREALAGLAQPPPRLRKKFLEEVSSAEQLEQRLVSLEEDLLQRIEGLEKTERQAGRSDWPETARPLQEQAGALDRKMQALEAELITVRERMLEDREALARRQQPLRLQVMECTWKLQQPGLPPAERAALQKQRLELEQRLQTEQPDGDVNLRMRRFELWEQLHRMKKERREALRALAGLLLAAPRRGKQGLLFRKAPPLVGMVLREQMVQVLEQIEDTVNLLRRYDS